ncbi:MAG TPA: 50S ribosomal protein L20 [Thermodesulfobacteriota bacterium]
MPRVKRAVNARKKRRKLFKRVKGFVGSKKKINKVAQEALGRAFNYAFRDRKARKRDFRRLWIVRINAAARAHDVSYSQLMRGLGAAGVEVDRKVLADLAVSDPAAFGRLVETARKSLPARAAAGA